MFGNRAIEMKLVKQTKSPIDEDVPEDLAVSYAAIADVAAANAAKHAINVIVTYMVADTIRKVVINRLTN